MLQPPLPKFDRNREFVVRRPIKVDGRSLNIGDPVPKRRLTDRRLKQLYTHGYIGMDNRLESLLSKLVSGKSNFQVLKREYSVITGEILPANVSKSQLTRMIKERLDGSS